MRAFRIAKIAVLVAGLITAGYMALSASARGPLTVVSKIEYPAGDKTIPVLLQPGSDGIVFIVEKRGKSGKHGWHDLHRLSTYDANWTFLREQQLPVTAACTDVLLTNAHSGYSYVAAYMNRPGGDILCGRISTDNKVTLDKLGSRWPTQFYVSSILPARDGIYAAGRTNLDRPQYAAAMKFGADSKPAWKATEHSVEAYYRHIVLDAQGNAICAGGIAAQMGACIGKYSPGGRKLWFRASTAYPGDTVWLGVRENGEILTIVRQDDTNPPPRLTSKEDYMLIVYSPSGRIIRRQLLLRADPWEQLGRYATALPKHTAYAVLSRRPGRSFGDAAMNAKGELYTLSVTQRQRRQHGYDHAIVTKYDPRGRVLWSGSIGLPSVSTAGTITLGEDKSIYITGGWIRKTYAPSPDLLAFIYKVREPD